MSPKRELPAISAAELILRPMTHEDIPEVLLLEQETPGAPHWSRDQYETSTGGPNEPVRRRAWVALHSGQFIAFAVVSELPAGQQVECELESLAVHPNAQQRGIGGALLAHVISQLKAASASLLQLEVRASNLAARHLYQRAGFAKKGVRKNYFPAGPGGPSEDAILMELTFPAAPGT